MNLQTKVSLKKGTRNLINYQSKVLLIGSCFSENIDNKLGFYKFRTLQNPFGILFHPNAIENLITNVINEKNYTEKDIIFNNERWHSLEAHSELSSSDKNELLTNLNTKIIATNRYLKEASHLIITLGTSWVYRHIETDTIVANCHKIPQKKFLKELLSVDEITESLDAITTLIKSVNSEAKVIFTVSPVRHLKDGFIENTQSKAHLITAIQWLLSSQAQSRDHSYFPSYEIMMDELRDYRFYAEDMLHPNKTAINYIWQKFSDVWISDEAQQTMQEVETIQRGLSHKPFNENSEQHQQFLQSLEAKISSLQEKHSFITF
ncbi:GSCFA family protein [Lutibacter sp. Hel_I_33_5]|uniref:GSCFA domain-containing protein n=1 Tax=Lutibacter sp. Hel_I_33_5 TaxID=1566289 RepID=UPI0011A6FD58|nr:GSCFA domain-containing protein [Lutibacter sp. Hel_I_33_5]TVZ56025.1 GSCFA family protein [Lutibacter sp. Hel_I_33_5]